MTFIPRPLPTKGPSPSDLWFVFRDDDLLVRTGAAGTVIPCSADLGGLVQGLLRSHYIGEYDGTSCYTGETAAQTAAPEGMSFEELRPLLWLLNEEVFAVAGRAFQILYWDRTHQFCGSCGTPTVPKAGEHAKTCAKCGLISYPEITPAIIVAVTRGREILLARSRRFHSNFYSVLAGFVEAGETFEESVRREVKEEVGIDLTNIRYFGSQPWPFPHSIMVGFTAEYAAGEIVMEEEEIVEASWFRVDDLPPIPRTGSIARRLIDWFIEGADS